MNVLRPAKRDGVDLHEVKDGLIIYAADADRVHYLNPTAALIFELCDGIRDTTEIAGLVARAFNLDTAPVAHVEEAVQQLLSERVLTA